MSLSYTYRCPRCPFTYDTPMAVLWVSHDCQPNDRSDLNALEAER